MPALDGSRVLVTGGAGFIGSHLVDELFRAGVSHVAVVDNFFLGREENLDDAKRAVGDRLSIHREDAADPGAMAAVVERERPDVVFNLATKALLYSFFNPPGACRVNLDIALTLLELLRAERFGRLVHLSSSEVYGTAQYVPMDEAHPLLAETTYAAGKAAADLAVASYVKMFDVDALTLRPFNNYGPRQNDLAFAAVIPLTVRRILGGEPPVIEGDGKQTRDFIFVEDTARAIVRLAAADEVPDRLMNLGSGHETSIEELVRAIADVMGWSGEVEHAPARAADVRRHCADVALATQALGSISTTPLADGLARTVEWYVAREAS